MSKINSAKKVWKDQGFFKGSIYLSRKSFQKVVRGKRGNISDVYSFISFKEERVLEKVSESKDLRIAWFIPDFSPGSGGHLNIFRFIYLLEQNHAVKSDVFICGPSQFGSPKNIKAAVAKYFYPLSGDFFVIKNETELTKETKEYDFAMATSWQTAYFVRAFGRSLHKSYFVQDFEPYFYAQGSNYAFAESSYKFGFTGITAGEWLKKKLSNTYGMKCESFSFSFDESRYKPLPRKDAEKKRIFFYARPPTERRGFELGVLALEKFYKKYPDVEIAMAGWDMSSYEFSFKYGNLGVVSPDELPALYSQCDVALVLSFTNLSLLPMELLACGCPCILNEGYNNSWIDPKKELFKYVTPDVENIVKKLESVLLDVEKSRRQTAEVRKKIENSTWANEVEKIYQFMKGL